MTGNRYYCKKIIIFAKRVWIFLIGLADKKHKSKSYEKGDVFSCPAVDDAFRYHGRQL
ncbi:Uncharacterised protein [Segatella oris]|uniref:Uncharacterized protein n=1 Tax=Segatella oris TaxID=28135 RepID=A0A448L6Q3_9BACT|nr:Uncharacterised protein [Segatella oris]